MYMYKEDNVVLAFTACSFSVLHKDALTVSNVSVVAVNETGKVRVTWSRPTQGAGQVITGYSVQYRRRGISPYTNHSVLASDATSYMYTIANLSLGTVYEVRVALMGPLGLNGYCCGSGKQVITYDREYKIVTSPT